MQTWCIKITQLFKCISLFFDISVELGLLMSSFIQPMGICIAHTRWVAVPAFFFLIGWKLFEVLVTVWGPILWKQMFTVVLYVQTFQLQLVCRIVWALTLGLLSVDTSLLAYDKKGILEPKRLSWCQFMFVHTINSLKQLSVDGQVTVNYNLGKNIFQMCLHYWSMRI